MLAMYSTGMCSAIILEIGDGVTQCLPIYEGYTIPHSIKRRNFAGQQVTEYLMQLLQSEGHIFSTSIEKEIVRDMKEKMNCLRHIKKGKSEEKENYQYKLPDGNIINLDMNNLKCG